MINKLFATFKYLGTIAITLLNISVVRVNATEYVFSAPPEIDNQITEIPSQEEYPLYECESESGGHGENELRDSHDCECVEDCYRYELEAEKIDENKTVESQSSKE